MWYVENPTFTVNILTTNSYTSWQAITLKREKCVWSLTSVLTFKLKTEQPPNDKCQPLRNF